MSYNIDRDNNLHFCGELLAVGYMAQNLHVVNVHRCTETPVRSILPLNVALPTILSL